MPPIPRTTARVLPVNADGEVLLMESRDPARPDDWHWVAVGGAVEAGETLEQGALRELREETGIVASAHDLTEPVHRGTHEFSWDGVGYLSDSTFFAMALDRAAEIRLDGLEAAEVGNVRRAAWWRPDALEGEGTSASPDLPRIMRAAIERVTGES